MTACPCSRGQVIWNNSDGELSFDRIDCFDCMEGKHIEKVLSPLRSSAHTTVYLVPDSIGHKDMPLQEIPKTFLEHLIYLYPYDKLLELENSFKGYTRISDIPKDRVLTAVLDSQYRYEHTRKLTSVRKNISEAIDLYLDSEYNYDKYLESMNEYRRYQQYLFDNSVLIERPEL